MSIKLAAALGATPAALLAATITVGDTAMPTYMYADPDPVPPVDAPFYPYYRFDESSAEKKPKTWQTVVLDNGVVRVTAFPGVGGKIWGAKDLATGVDYVYHNHVAKFRDISMCGPWTSGGIEFNFGVMGHAPYVSQNVDWCVRTNADRSVSYFCGGYERVARAFWQVETRLRDGDRFFTTHIVWYNASGLPAPYYHWMNAGFAGGGGTRYLFPGANWIGHGGDPHPWPLENGHHIDTYRENDIPGKGAEDHRSMHVLNGDNRLFGVWWPERKVGAYHRNATDEKFGRKIWMWALSRQGEMWHGLLTDDDGPYVELQSGRCFQQPGHEYARTPFKFPSFTPGRTEAFTEEWGVLAAPEDFEKFKPSTESIDRPLETPPDMNWDGAWGRYVLAQQLLNSHRNDAEAERGLKSALELEPCLSPALDALAALYVRQGRMDEARAMARKALAIDAYDPQANYFEGLVLMANGRNGAAAERFGVAAIDQAWRAAALVESARLRMRAHDWTEAASLAEKALAANAFDLHAILARAIALRKSGRASDAVAVADAALERAPLFHALRYERAKAAGGGEWKSFVRNMFADDTFSEIASWYEGAGLFDESLELYAASASPIARIRAANVMAAQGRADDAAKQYDAAEAAATDFVFPYRREDVPALERATGARSSWKFKYYLAAFLAANGAGDRADALLSECGDSPDSAAFYVFRARRRHGDPAREDLARATRIADSWRVGRELGRTYSEEKNWAKARDVLAGYAKRYAGNDFLELDYARALLESGDAEGAAEFLENVATLPSELGEKPAAIYQDALVKVAEKALARGDEMTARTALDKATSFPERLGMGRPYSLNRIVESWPKPVREFYRANEKMNRIEEGDRVLFLGDSITQWSGYVALLRYHWAKTHPGSKTEFLNGGRGGATVSEGLARAPWEIEKQKPTRVVVMFGANDAAKDAPDKFRRDLSALVDLLKSRGLPVSLMTPTPYDEYGDCPNIAPDKGRNEVRLARLAQIVREVSMEKKTGLVELHRPLTALLKDHPSVRFFRDRLHPTKKPGSETLAAEILKGLGEPYNALDIDAVWNSACEEGVRRREELKRR